MIDKIYEYSFVPSLIVVILIVLLILAWTFGTDFYDNIESELTDDTTTFMIVHGCFSMLSTVLWFTLKDVTFIWFLCAAWNTWMVFVLVIFFVFMFFEVLENVRNYCLAKRGKK